MNNFIPDVIVGSYPGKPFSILHEPRTIVEKSERSFTVASDIASLIASGVIQSDVPWCSVDGGMLEVLGDKVCRILSKEHQNEGYSVSAIVLEKKPEFGENLSKIIGIEKEKITSVLLADPNTLYRCFDIPKKSGGVRRIEAPSKELKEIQKAILHNILYAGGATKYAHGFVCGKGIKSNAQAHCGKRWIVKFDLQNFFPSITSAQVAAALSERLDKNGLLCLGELVSLLCFQGRLSQGAPTSPCMSNIVCTYMDLTFGGFANKNDLVYTRYADDLTFSGNDDGKIKKLMVQVKRIVNKFGFKLNFKKTGIFRKGSKKTVTGLIVHENDVTVSRQKRRVIRAAIHNALTRKTLLKDIDIPYLLGNAAFFGQAKEEHGIGFFMKVEEVTESIFHEVMNSNEKMELHKNTKPIIAAKLLQLGLEPEEKLI